MPTPIKRGSTDPQLQYWEQEFAFPFGVKSTNVFKGIDLPKMSALAQTYFNTGQSGTLRFEKDVATLTIRTSDGLIAGGPAPGITIVDKWEVGVDEERPSLFENQNFLGIAQANDNTGTTGYNLQSKQIIQKIKFYADSGSATAWSDFYTAMSAPIIGPDGITPIAGTHLSDGINFIGAFPNLKLFVDDYFRGATNFVHSKYRVRHTTQCPSNYSSNVADFNIENIYTISQLLSECQNGALWILPLPSYLAFKVTNYPVPTNMPPNFLFGALKLRSNAITASRGRIEITQEYLVDAWPIHTYGTI